MNPLQCPKCAYVRRPTDEAPIYECPSCGIVYTKYSPTSQPFNPTKQHHQEVISAELDLKANPKTGSNKHLMLLLYFLVVLGALMTTWILFGPNAFILISLGLFLAWAVKKAIDGSREEEKRRLTELEKAPYQHCMTWGHDFKSDRGSLRGNTTIEIALWVLFLWPIALVYSIWRRLSAGKAKIACAVCASTQVIPANSPAAIAHKRTLTA